MIELFRKEIDMTVEGSKSAIKLAEQEMKEKIVQDTAEKK